jgi:hypothetical protein
MMTFDLRECVAGQPTFQFYRGGHLYYKTENGLLFPVPASDISDVTLTQTDRTLVFARHISAFLEDMSAEKEKP